MTRGRRVAVAVLASLLPAALATAQPSFRDLGYLGWVHLDLGPFTNVFDISGDGSTVVGSS